VQPSSVHGQGVFANQNIGRAELISEYKGARVSWQDVVQGASSYGKTPGHTFLFGRLLTEHAEAAPSAG